MELHFRAKYYTHVLESVINVNSTTIMWDVPVIKGRTILANRPGIALLDKKREYLPTDRSKLPKDRQFLPV